MSDWHEKDGKPFVIDAVIHAYNRDESNCRNDIARKFRDVSYGLGIGMPGHEAFLSREDFARDWDIDTLASIVFVESDVDFAVYHAVPLDDWFYDGLVSNDKGAAMHARWPERVMFYGAVNPLDGQAALEKAEYLVRECGASGIKLYPERYQGSGASVPVDLRDAPVEELLATAERLGVVVAIHKAMPAFHGRTDHYRLGDVEAAAATFPTLQIEVVHSGLAFLDETVSLLARYHNVWANLEVTSLYSVRQKRRFAEALGALLSTGAADRIVFASGTTLTHPQPIIEAFQQIELPEDLVEGYGYPQVSSSDIEGMLGLNFARLHGLDPEIMMERTHDDEFSRARRALSERPRPWSTVKKMSSSGT